jgi:hypothetical protein
VIDVFYLIVSDAVLTSVSVADVGVFVVPVFACYVDVVSATVTTTSILALLVEAAAAVMATTVSIMMALVNEMEEA